MIKEKYLLKIYLTIAAVGWLALLATNLMMIQDGAQQVLSPTLRPIFFNIFIIGLFFYFRRYFKITEPIGITELLQRIFNYGLIAVAVVLLNRVLLTIFGTDNGTGSIEFYNVLYHVVIGVTAIFLLHTFKAFRQFVLYQRTKTLINLWYFFEYGALVTLLLSLANFDVFKFPNILALAIFVGVALFLAFNVKWVPYLDFKQKLQSALLMGATLIFLVFILKELAQLSDNPILVYHIRSNVFLLILFIFIALYCLTSSLVSLFNLPTSSVYEQRAEEVNNFQRLSRGVTYNEDKSRVYEVLMDACIGATHANSAWILVNDSSNEQQVFISKDMTRKTSDEISQALFDGISLQQRKKLYHRNLNIKKLLPTFRNYTFRSMLVVPLVREKKRIGLLMLCKDVIDGFDKESIGLIRSYVAQASITLQNFRLIGQALENERYQEELNIAKKVQKSLLPEDLILNPFFKLTVFSQSADSVGGDYYDVYQLTDNRFALGIGDVSGKGTSAAFNMAQLKGVFQSLAQLDLPTNKFMELANSALGRCLENSSFITMIYLAIDTTAHTVEFTRAGHCPMLYLPATGEEPYYLETKGLGLGILREKGYEAYLECRTLDYKPGDRLLLFTDGIVEAKNDDGEEYGTDRVKDFARNFKKGEKEELIELLIKNVHHFCPGGDLNDDYTAMLIEFKE